MVKCLVCELWASSWIFFMLDYFSFYWFNFSLILCLSYLLSLLLSIASLGDNLALLNLSIIFLHRLFTGGFFSFLSSICCLNFLSSFHILYFFKVALEHDLYAIRKYIHIFKRAQAPNTPISPQDEYFLNSSVLMSWL